MSLQLLCGVAGKCRIECSKKGRVTVLTQVIDLGSAGCNASSERQSKASYLDYGRRSPVLDNGIAGNTAPANNPAPPQIEVWQPKFNPWLIGVVVAVAAFMEVLDTSIANVALPYIGGNLGATTDQSTWVLTSYLVSNAVVLPISGWLASVLGRKRFFMTCLAIFTVSSLLCGFAPSLGAIILFRILQGAGGGGLQPMAQAILADTFPPGQAWLGVRALRRYGHRCAYDWAHPGRLDHRQLHLALDLLHQSSDRDCWHCSWFRV